MFESSRPDTQQLLEMIGELYSIEADIRGKAADERLRVRQERTKPLLAQFDATIKAKLATLSTKSKLTKAINYSLNHWGGAHVLLRGLTLPPDPVHQN